MQTTLVGRANRPRVLSQPPSAAKQTADDIASIQVSYYRPPFQKRAFYPRSVQPETRVARLRDAARTRQTRRLCANAAAVLRLFLARKMAAVSVQAFLFLPRGKKRAARGIGVLTSEKDLY